MKYCYSGQKYVIKGRTYKIPEKLYFKDKQEYLGTVKLDILSDLIESTIKILEENNIFYMAVAGTLLSTIRHKALMPWDDDADLAYKKDDHNKIKELKDLFYQKKLILSESSPGFCVYFNGNKNIALDLFTLDKNSKGRYVYSWPNNSANGDSLFYIHNISFPKEYWYKNELINIKKYKLNHFYIYAPKNSIDILKRTYSDNVLKEVVGCSSTKLHKFRSVGLMLEKPLISILKPETSIAKTLYKKIANFLHN